MDLKFLLILATSFLITCLCEDDIAPEVKITDGKLRGTILHTHTGKNIYAFLGVPYARPPLGELRFNTPKPPVKWDNVRDAIKEGNHCPQLTYPEKKYKGEEDCLYLNVYTNRLPNVTSLQTNQQDVIVVFHAGGFTYGSGDIAQYGPDYLLDQDIVMVTCNYRLGALGFLATGDEAASGNYGLKDQVDVMRWVRRNIAQFSGNPNRVTILGSHAGGASVHYHMLSGLSRDLFHRAISQSGTALSPWAHVRAKTAKERAIKLGELVGCKKEDLKSSKNLIKCLRKIPEKQLVEMSSKILDHLTKFAYPFVPVEDEIVPQKSKPLLHNRPINIMQKPLYGLWEIPWLVGVTSHEGLPQSLQIMAYPNLMEGLNSDHEKYVLQYLGLDIKDKGKAQMIAHKIWDFYFKNETLSYGNLVKLAEMTTDYNYYYGLVKSVNTFLSGNDFPIFVYNFSYNRHDSRTSLGVPHGDDTLFMFPDIVANVKLVVEKEHFHITERLLRIATNFAHTGDPTPKESVELGDLLWPDIQPNDFQYLDIGKDLVIKKGFYEERMKFWDDIFHMTEAEEKPAKDEL